MADRSDSCEARIKEHLEGRENDFAALFALANEEKVECLVCEGTGENAALHDCSKCEGTGEVLPEYEDEVLTQDDAYTRLSEYPLAVDVTRVVKIQLSTGGPGDWLEAELYGRDVQNVTYHFNDWFDHAERPVEPDSALWKAAEYYAEYVVGEDS